MATVNGGVGPDAVADGGDRTQVYTATVDDYHLTGPDAPTLACGDCGEAWSYDELADIGDCMLTPGDPSPAGRCPECETLVYPPDTDRKELARLRAAVATVPAAVLDRAAIKTVAERLALAVLRGETSAWAPLADAAMAELAGRPVEPWEQRVLAEGVCPQCGSVVIDRRPLYDGDGPHEEEFRADCTQCDTSWTEVYRLTRVYGLTTDVREEKGDAPDEDAEAGPVS